MVSLSEKCCLVLLNQPDVSIEILDLLENVLYKSADALAMGPGHEINLLTFIMEGYRSIFQNTVSLKIFFSSKIDPPWSVDYVTRLGNL
jgi:hypothetical protein